VSHETSAYIQVLQQQNTLLRNELRKEKDANIKLIYVFHLSDHLISYCPIHRAGHNRLLEVHNRLSEYLDSNSKNGHHSRLDVPRPLPSPATQAVQHEETKPTTLDVPLRSNCPDIKYWTKKEWNEAQSAKKNSSDPMDQPGA
jgi:hypothetical protein